MWLRWDRYSWWAGIGLFPESRWQVIKDDVSYKHLPGLPVHQEELTAFWLQTFWAFFSDRVSIGPLTGTYELLHLLRHSYTRTQWSGICFRQMADALNLRFLVCKMKTTTTSLLQTPEWLNKMASYGSPVKNPLAMKEMRATRVHSLGGEDPLEEEMATHSTILAWKISWTEEPGGWQKVRHDLVINNILREQTYGCHGGGEVGDWWIGSLGLAEANYYM